MNKIFETKDIIVWFDEEKKLQKSVWTGHEQNITEEEIKEIITKCGDLIIEKRPAYYLSDDSKRSFVYNVEIQDWVANTVATACLKGNVKKFAVIMPVDLLSELSTEQVVDEVGQVPFQLKYFKNETDAQNWLFA